jgi:hypothetical protein
MTYLPNLTISYLHLIAGINDIDDVMQTWAIFCVDELLTGNGYINHEMEKSNFLVKYNVILDDRMLVAAANIQKSSRWFYDGSKDLKKL